MHPSPCEECAPHRDPGQAWGTWGRGEGGFEASTARTKGDITHRCRTHHAHTQQATAHSILVAIPHNGYRHLQSPRRAQSWRALLPQAPRSASVASQSRRTRSVNRVSQAGRTLCPWPEQCNRWNVSQNASIGTVARVHCQCWVRYRCALQCVVGQCVLT